MIKTYRLRNLLMSEQITGPELETLLQKKDYLGALYDLRNDKVWMADICQHPGAMALVAVSETAMSVFTASEVAMEAIWVSEVAMEAINNSNTAKEALFLSAKKAIRSFDTNSSGYETWLHVATGRGVFVRFQGQEYIHNKIRIDGTKEASVTGSDFFKIIPYTTKLEFRHVVSGKIHYIPFGA